MTKATDYFAQAIKAMLDRRAAEDELFSQSYRKEGKSITECCDYIIGEVSAMGVTALSDDDGLRLATVEYSISRGEVLQCRGRHNSKPQRYKDIIRMFDTCRLNIERFTNRP